MVLTRILPELFDAPSGVARHGLTLSVASDHELATVPKCRASRYRGIARGGRISAAIFGDDTLNA